MAASAVRRVTVVLVGGLVLTGCSSSGTEGPTPTPTTDPASAAPSPSPTPSEDAAATEAAVLEAYHGYWDAVVEAQRGNPDPTLFEGVATGPLVEEAVAEARQFQELGIVREGEPTFSRVTVEVDGTDATVLACVDNSEWVVPGVEDDLADVLPGGVVLERRDGAWLVVDTERPPEEFTC